MDRNKQKKYKQEYYLKNRAKFKKYFKKYKRQHRGIIRKQAKRYYYNSTDRKKKQAVRDYTRWLLRSGKVIKVKCVYCNSRKNLEFHHPDYSNPKRYIILCKNCHMKEHKKIEGKVL